MKCSCKKTSSKRTASKGGKALQSKTSSKTTKTLAGSVVAQAKCKKRKK